MKKLTKKPAMINTPPDSSKRISPMMLRYKAHIKNNIIITIILVVVAIVLLIMLR